MQLGKHVNPDAFASEYARSAAYMSFTTPVPPGIDASGGHGSSFKFNLDLLDLYHLVKLETNDFTRSWYEKGFELAHGATDNHLNAHFNMIDRALHGPDAVRDSETRALLA